MTEAKEKPVLMIKATSFGALDHRAQQFHYVLYEGQSVLDLQDPRAWDSVQAFVVAPGAFIWIDSHDGAHCWLARVRQYAPGRMIDLWIMQEWRSASAAVQPEPDIDGAWWAGPEKGYCVKVAGKVRKTGFRHLHDAELFLGREKTPTRVQQTAIV
jgi:hypothetical protein